jgi:hypothetical protein
MKAGSIELASERVGHLRRAMTFLESDREAAWQCLNEVAALLGPRAQDSDTNSALAIEPSSPGGLAAWQAKRTLASRSFRRLVGVSPGIWRRSKSEWVGLASYGEVAARASGRIVLRPQD